MYIYFPFKRKLVVEHTINLIKNSVGMYDVWSKLNAK